MERVLRPGGRVLLLEHVGSPRFVVRTIQRALEPIAVRLEGDHLVREPLELLRAEVEGGEECGQHGGPPGEWSHDGADLVPFCLAGAEVTRS
jgi:hypothetical protein